jgi:hypothetical protein
VDPSPLLLRPVTGLLYQSRRMMVDGDCGAVGECLAGETEILGESLPQCRFVHKSRVTCPEPEPRSTRWEAA